MMTNILTGQTYSQCSVIAAAQPSASVRGMFDLAVRLEGWREEVVMEVITKHFSHSPNKVLALQLKLSHSQHQPHRNYHIVSFALPNSFVESWSALYKAEISTKLVVILS